MGPPPCKAYQGMISSSAHRPAPIQWSTPNAPAHTPSAMADPSVILVRLGRLWAGDTSKATNWTSWAFVPLTGFSAKSVVVIYMRM